MGRVNGVRALKKDQSDRRKIDHGHILMSWQREKSWQVCKLQVTTPHQITTTPRSKPVIKHIIPSFTYPLIPLAACCAVCQLRAFVYSQADIYPYAHMARY